MATSSKKTDVPFTCTFKLNKQPSSALACPGLGNFAAFSGRDAGRNNPDAVGKEGTGPLPPGTYYIVDRTSGGHLGWLYDVVRSRIYGTDRSRWFALYRNDDVIDDETFVNGVKRGGFRLHPIGPLRLSEGCITLTDVAQFDRLRDALLQRTQFAIPGSKLTAYGTVEVIVP